MKKLLLILVLLVLSGLTLPRSESSVGGGFSLPRSSSLSNPQATYPIFELDEPMKELVPKKFSVKYTAFSINTPVNVSAYFRVGVENVLVYREIREYFINHEVVIDAGRLENETQYEFIWEIRDSVGLFKVNVYLIEVDPSEPVIVLLEFSKKELVYGELLEVQYQILETNFESIEVYIDGENKATWTSRAGTEVLPWTMFVLPEGFLEKTFQVEFYVYDRAGNEAYANYSIHYHDNRFGFYDPGAVRQEMIKAILIAVGVLVVVALSLVAAVGFYVKKRKDMAPQKVSGVSVEDFVGEGKKSKGKVTSSISVGRRIIDFSRRKKK